MTGDEIKSNVLQYGYRKCHKSFVTNAQTIEEMHWTHPRPPISLAELIYTIVNSIDDLPKCRNGKDAKFSRFYNDGYLMSCVNYRECGCLRATRAEISSRPRTAEQKQEQQERYQSTMMARYGVTNSFQSPEINAKIRATNLKRYGVEFVSQSREIRERVENTCLERYGTKHSGSSEIVRNKSKVTNLERYGHEHFIASPDGRARSAVTMLERHGVDNPFKSAIFQKKAKDSVKKLYGIDNIGQIHLSEATKFIIHNRDEFLKFCTGKSFEKVSDLLGDVTASHIGSLARKFDCLDIFAFGKGSIYQDQCEDWLKNIGVEFTRNNRTIIKPKEIDIWIPSAKLGIEIDGLFYHSEIAGNKSRQYHYDKQQSARAANISLLQVFTDDWIHRREIVQSVISRTLGLGNPTKVMARACTIEEIDWSILAPFINDNHLQGCGAPTKYNYALMHNGMICAVMSFAYNRRSTSTKGWELVRWCQPRDLHILGGAQKLFNHATKALDIEAVTSFSDRRMFSGRVYYNLGFNYLGHSKAGYHYTDYQRRYNRFNFTKQKLIKHGHDSKKTEWQIMQSLNYDRIWDSGQDRWQWSKNIAQSNNNTI